MIVLDYQLDQRFLLAHYNQIDLIAQYFVYNLGVHFQIVFHLRKFDSRKLEELCQHSTKVHSLKLEEILDKD
jgi:hypothetical protein